MLIQCFLKQSWSIEFLILWPDFNTFVERLIKSKVTGIHSPSMWRLGGILFEQFHFFPLCMIDWRKMIHYNLILPIFDSPIPNRPIIGMIYILYVHSCVVLEVPNSKLLELLSKRLFYSSILLWPMTSSTFSCHIQWISTTCTSFVVRCIPSEEVSNFWILLTVSAYFTGIALLRRIVQFKSFNWSS